MATYQNVIKPLEDTYVVLQSKSATVSGSYYTWSLNNSIQINENAYLTVVERFYSLNNSHGNNKMPILLRLIPNSSSFVHPVNRNPANFINEGTIIDIGYDHEPASRQIEVKLPSQQNINEIIIQMTNTFEGNTAMTNIPEFLIIIKIVEREPRNLRYGALNNIQQ
jgi:hypothetical protein